jgi:hypothetical protein
MRRLAVSLGRELLVELKLEGWQGVGLVAHTVPLPAAMSF